MDSLSTCECSLQELPRKIRLIRVLGLLTISASSIIASFIAVWIAVSAMPTDMTLLAPLLIIPTFCLLAGRFFSLNGLTLMMIAVFMLSAWLFGAIYLVPEHAGATEIDKTGYDYHKYDFRAHFASISVGLVLVLIFDDMRRNRIASRLVTVAFLLAITVFGVVWFDVLHEPVEGVSSLRGQTEVNALDRLGEPDVRYGFYANEPVGEFRVMVLKHTYPPGTTTAESIWIREYTWHYWRYKITLWLHEIDGKWTVFDTLRYKNSVTF